MIVHLTAAGLASHKQSHKILRSEKLAGKTLVSKFLFFHSF